MRRHQTTRAMASMAGTAVVAALMVAIPSAGPALAALYNPIPMNQYEEPTYDFVDDDALFVYVTSDIKGGTVCIVEASVSQPSEGSCDSPAWGSSNYIVGIGSVIQPIEAPTLNPGQWRLLTEDSIGDPVALSEVFTVLACDTCSREFAVEAVNRWKQTAATNQVGAGIACSVLEKKAAVDEAKEIGLVKTDWTPTGITLVSIGYSLGGGFAFSVANPFEVSQQKALAILKDLTCAVSNMYDDIVKDPPDPNYGTVIVPVFGTVDDLASPEATALARSLSRQVGLADASLTSFERYLGAAADNDAAGVARQATATADQTFQLVAELRLSAAALETFAAYADTQPELSGPVAATQTEIDELAAAYQRVRTSGFTPGELAQLTAILFSPAEIAAFTTNFQRDLSVITPGVSLGDYARTLATTMRSSIPDLDAFAREASAVGARNELDLGVNLPPTAEFAATPASGVGPLAVSFDASASADPDGTISSYTSGLRRREWLHRGHHVAHLRHTGYLQRCADGRRRRRRDRQCVDHHRRDHRWRGRARAWPRSPTSPLRPLPASRPSRCSSTRRPRRTTGRSCRMSGGSATGQRQRGAPHRTPSATPETTLCN